MQKTKTANKKTNPFGGDNTPPKTAVLEKPPKADALLAEIDAAIVKADSKKKQKTYVKSILERCGC